jgi:hypothetical protein
MFVLNQIEIFVDTPVISLDTHGLKHGGYFITEINIYTIGNMNHSCIMYWKRQKRSSI